MVLDSLAILQDLNKPVMLMLTERVFLGLLRPLLTEEKQPVMSSASMQLSATPPFPWSGKVADVKKTIFNLTPCENDFEQLFVRFLEDASDIAAFANLGNLKPNLSIEYLDGDVNLRQYEPDFVARATDGTYWLIETKGREDADVARKDARAHTWCADVSALTGQAWRYLKVPEKEFKRLKADNFGELASAIAAGGPMFVME